jgi:lycopene cyclase domain-containing protein
VSFLYLAALLISLGGLAMLDYRFKLGFAANAKRAAITIAVPYVLFLAWDYIGIELGIFARGDSQFMLGIEIIPDFPLEELFFLVVLCYTGLLITAALARRSK